MADIDNRGDELHRQNEGFLRDRIKALEARVKELEDILALHDKAILANMETLTKVKMRGGWGNG